MTKTTLSGQKIAIMVATGFEEKNFVEIQRMLNWPERTAESDFCVYRTSTGPDRDTARHVLPC